MKYISSGCVENWELFYHALLEGNIVLLEVYGPSGPRFLAGDPSEVLCAIRALRPCNSDSVSLWIVLVVG